MTFDITIPVLNEEKTLVQQVNILHTFLKQHFPTQQQWRIVIADNGSTDNTLQLAHDLATQNVDIQVVKVPRRGVGLALKTSWMQSNADIVGYMDLDMATDLTHFLETYKALSDGFDVVYATRLHPKSIVIGRSAKRELTSRVFNFILKKYLNVKFTDGMCGFKFLKRSHLDTIMSGGAQNDGWFFSTELLTIAEWQGLKLYELPVKWTDDPDSKVNISALTKQYLKAMQELKMKKR